MTEIKNSPIIITGTSPYIKNGNNKPTASFTEVNRVTLPSAHYGIIDNVGLTDFINDADIARYEKVRQFFCEDMAKSFGIPVENVKVRVPQIKPLEAKKAMEMQLIAGYMPVDNQIKMTSIREILNSRGGGDEPIIMHECTHGYIDNLRRAYAAQISPEQLYYECCNTIATRMLNGESGQVFGRIVNKEINGQIVPSAELIDAPYLSYPERQIVIGAINNILTNNPNTQQIKPEDIKDLVHQFKDYAKSFDGEPEEVTAKVSQGITDYINSFFVRRDILRAHLNHPSLKQLPGNLETPLTEGEKNLAKAYLYGVVPLKEKTMLLTETKEFSGQAHRDYFMCDEERCARIQENRFRLYRVNQQIESFERNGFHTPESLLKEKHTVEANMKILDLANQLANLDEKILFADKAPQKVSKYFRIRHEKEATFEEKPASFEKKDFKPHPMRRKHHRLRQKFAKLSRPENLFTDTPENNELKERAHKIISEIKRLALNSDIDLPGRFIFSKDVKSHASRKAGNAFAKWAKRLKVKLPN